MLPEIRDNKSILSDSLILQNYDGLYILLSLHSIILIFKIPAQKLHGKVKQYLEESTCYRNITWKCTLIFMTHSKEAYLMESLMNSNHFRLILH